MPRGNTWFSSQACMAWRLGTSAGCHSRVSDTTHSQARTLAIPNAFAASVIALLSRPPTVPPASCCGPKLRRTSWWFSTHFNSPSKKHLSSNRIIRSHKSVPKNSITQKNWEESQGENSYPPGSKGPVQRSRSTNTSGTLKTSLAKRLGILKGKSMDNPLAKWPCISLFPLISPLAFKIHIWIYLVHEYCRKSNRLFRCLIYI